jgi:hypothetical protein
LNSSYFNQEATSGGITTVKYYLSKYENCDCHLQLLIAKEALGNPVISTKVLKKLSVLRQII